MVTPQSSVMSISSGFPPSGSFQSKWYRRLARAISTFACEKFMPGHILRPTPNGVWYPCILQSSKHTLGTNGAGGCNRKVSLMTALR
ncbi:hypothetical protein PVAP13_1NG168019 [Panicum virgatum]|uniref:Uncharacterized protein n=1 Tax=Panicum virgatum TaxID=38727 RepID=A0A8T0WSJ2_PANVG|nr:hypothetical protein PVAP13_1NG168019 [Panicum virgatum]